MVELTLHLTSGDDETVDLPDRVPGRVGLDTRRKLGFKVEGRAKDPRIDKTDVNKKMSDAKEYLAKEILEHHTDYTIDDVTLETIDDIAELYWDQIQTQSEGPDEEQVVQVLEAVRDDEKTVDEALDVLLGEHREGNDQGK